MLLFQQNLFFEDVEPMKKRISEYGEDMKVVCWKRRKGQRGRQRRQKVRG